MQHDHQKLKISGQIIKPGERKTVMLKMPKLYDWTPLRMPVHVVRGTKPGPVVLVSAAIHGDEINGIEIIWRLLKKPVLKKLSGTLIAIPIVNVYGFLYQDRYLMDRRDLNRAFPGSKKGSLAGRLAHLLTSEIISQCTHVIDLHTGSLHRGNLPQIRANTDCPQTAQLASAFNAPVILHASLRDGSMRQYASERGIPFLLYEAGESLRFDELSIKSGVKGILNVMSALGMLGQQKIPGKRITPMIARSSYWIRAPISGILRPNKILGKKVKKGELLAKIGSPISDDEHEILSPFSGIIIGMSHLPMAHAGAAVFHIACFEEPVVVAEQIESLQEYYGENPDYLIHS